MKTINILSLIINILYYSLFILGTLVFGCLILHLLGYDFGIKTTINIQIENKTLYYFAIFSTFFYYSFYTYSIYLFKRNMESFKNRSLFTSEVVQNFKFIGLIYLIGYFVSTLVRFFVPIFKNNKLNIGIGYDEESLNGLYDFPLNGLIIGLLFLTLSKVFQIAKNQKEENIELKQENELTI